MIRGILKSLVTIMGLLILLAGIGYQPSIILAQDPAPATPTVSLPEDIDGTIVSLGTIMPNWMAPRSINNNFFRIHVTGFSTPEEIVQYANLLKEKGPDALVSALDKAQEKGFIQIGSSLGYHIAAIRSIDTDTGRIIRAVTDRPIQFIEAFDRTRTYDYPFGILEIILDKDGKGEGKMIAAAKIDFNNDGNIQIESYDNAPFRLMGVKVQQSKAKK